MTILLSLQAFKENVLKRDKEQCVICQAKTTRVQHLISSRLWDDQGHYLDNGVSICDQHKHESDLTTVSVEELRKAAGITHVIVPEQFYVDQRIDRWGNHIINSNKRSMGPLFQEEFVQNLLLEAQVLDLFDERCKYPRTFHLPHSMCVHSDDKVMKPEWIANFYGKDVIVSEKCDGENSTLSKHYYHARSLDSKNHESRNWAKNYWGQIRWNIPDGWRLVCENLFMEHSIRYENLESYLYGLNIWDETNTCLNWDDTTMYFEDFGIPQPEVIYDGIFDMDIIKGLYDGVSNWDSIEGIVVRLKESFHYSQFHKSVAKVVRKDHVQDTGKHILLNHNVTANKLKS